ncbi:MAG: S8 family serine peptidase [Planctomycetes bacterium]|nr:S8 family serine peptidase [Planctomycetota bacterium]
MSHKNGSHLLSLIAAAVAAGSLAAQEPQRIELPSPQNKTATVAPAQPGVKTTTTAQAFSPIVEREVEGGSYVPPEDDLPQYAPMLTVRGEDDSNPTYRYDGNPYRLSFTNGDFTPERGVDAALAGDAAARGSTFGFVMIHGRITEAKLKKLTDVGVKLLGPHTWQSFKAEIPVGAVPALRQFDFVHWVGYSRPEQKLDKVLAEALKTAAPTDKLDIWVNFFKSDIGPKTKVVKVGEDKTLSERHDQCAVSYTIPNGPFQAELEAMGFQFSFYSDTACAMRGLATKEQILKIRELNFVVAIELQHGVGSIDHDQSLAMVSVDRVRSAYPGSLVKMGWIDTGIDSSPWHSDIGTKKFRAWATTTESAYQDGSGHGSHTGGTIFGEGNADRRYTGVCPAIGAGAGSDDRIYVGRFLDDSGNSVGNPQTLWDVFKVSTTSGGITTAKRSIVSNSWSFKSSSGYSGTETNSRDLDTVIYTYQQTYVHSSGNTGSVAGTWCGSPSVAKNCLTVGSVRDWFSSTVRPGDVVTSVRYQTTDGRRKPEITAPGETLTSLNINTTTGYTNKSGTSMSTPTVSGVLASVVQRNPSFYEYKPAGLRALAVASAKFGTGVGFDSTFKEGFGMINAYKMQYASSRSTYSNHTGQVTASANLDTFDVAIDPNCDQLKVVLNWNEPAASSSATAARVNALRCYFDIPPYTSGATGEYSMSSSQDTVIFSTSLTSALKGQTIRFKIHGYSMTSGAANWGCCVFQYLQPLTSTPTLNQTVDKTIVKPSETVVLTTTLNALSTQDEFSNAHIYYSSPTSWTNTRIDRTTADGLLQTYTGSTHTSFPYPALGTEITKGMTVGQGSSRQIKFTMQAPTTSGSYSLYTRATQHGSTGTTLSNASTVCVDGLAPSNLSGLTANRSTSTWYNTTSITFSWTKATDNGCSGVDNLRYERSDSGLVNPTTSSPSLSAATTGFGTSWSGSGNNKYFAVRVYDNAGNQSGSAYVGPFWVDLTAPTLSTVQTNTPQVSALSANVAVSGSDTFSGVQYVQYSNDNSTWSGNFAYTTAYRSVSLSAYGGNTAEGTKFVYARLVDGAGNVSTSLRVAVTYMAPPVITSTSTPSQQAVNKTYFRFIGSGFTETTLVSFGGNITTAWNSTNEDWWANGAFRVISDTEIWVFPIQGLTPGTYGVRTYNGLSYSNTQNVTVAPTVGHILRTNNTLTAGATQTIKVTKDGLAPTVSQQFVMASIYKIPSVLPGIYNFGIGNNFTQLIFLPAFGFDGNGVSTVVFPTQATFKGVTGYFQSGYLDFTANVVWPMPASDVWSTTYK